MNRLNAVNGAKLKEDTNALKRKKLSTNSKKHALNLSMYTMQEFKTAKLRTNKKGRYEFGKYKSSFLLPRYASNKF